MTSNKQNNNTITNLEVSGEFPQKLKEPEKFGFKDTETMTSNKQDNTMTNNATEKEWTLYRRFILLQFAKHVPEEGLRMDDDDMNQFVDEIFNNYNQDVRDEVENKGEYSKDEMEYYNKVMDEAVDEFGYDLIKGKNHTEKMELFIYLEAKEVCRELYERQLKQDQYVASGQQERDHRNLIICKIKDKFRDCDACFGKLFSVPEAEHTTETFYVGGEGFENGEVQYDMDALFGLNDTPHKDLASEIVKDAIDKYHARFGKDIYDKYHYLVKERNELVRKAKVTDELIAELKKQLKDYHDNSYNGDEMEEKLEEREEEILDGLYVGGEFDEKYCEIILEGRREILDALMEFREGLEE